MARLGNPHAYTTHAKTSEENIDATRYLQSNIVVIGDPNVHLCFHSLPFPSYSKTPRIQTLQYFSKKSLSIQEYEREGERIMRELQKCTDKRYQLILRSLFIEDSSIFFIFHYFHSFSSLHATCDLSSPFSPNFCDFHK